MDGFDVGLGLEGSHVLVTGGCGFIGSVVVKAFLAADCLVTIVDIKSPTLELPARCRYFKADVAEEEGLGEAFEKARNEFGPVQICVAVAGKDLSFIPHHQSLADLPLTQWRETMRVNVDGTFLTARQWMRSVRDHATAYTKNLSFIIFGSEAGSMGVRSNADYASSKAAISYGLVRSLAPDAVGIHPHARVNAVMPGPVDTPQFQRECEQDQQARWVESEATVAQRRPTSMDSIARTCLFLSSDRFSSSITGQLIAIDGGKTGKLLWSSDGKAV